MYVRHAAFIQNADCFDALIFGISGAEVQFGWKLGLLQMFFFFFVWDIYIIASLRTYRIADS